MGINEDQDWREVWQAVTRLADNYHEIVFIGGVAVYAHMANSPSPMSIDMTEFSHDVDLCISLAEFGDMRDIEVVTPNRRLNKHQIEIGHVEVDVYVEHGHRLAVPFGDLYAGSVCYDNIRIAGLEHLMVLKLDAAQDRWATPKGAKDRRDIAKIGWAMAENVRPDLIIPYLNDVRRKTLMDTAKSTAFADIALGNVHLAKTLRHGFASFMGHIDDGENSRLLRSVSETPASAQKPKG